MGYHPVGARGYPEWNSAGAKYLLMLDKRGWRLIRVQVNDDALEPTAALALSHETAGW